MEVFRDAWLLGGEDPPATPAFGARLEAQWPFIQRGLLLLKALRQKVRDSELGYVEVRTPASAQDDKKIFEIINTAGVKLTLAEILSATPVWNDHVEVPEDSTVSEDVKGLYEQLKVEYDGTVRKWDVAATLLDRLDAPVVWGAKTSWAWRAITVKRFDRKITLGFRTMSGHYQRRLMKNDVAKLASHPEVDWSSLSFEGLSGAAQERVHELWVFKRLWEWRFNLADELSDAIAMDFLLMITRDWVLKGEPAQAGAQRDAFDRNACRLLDRLIYEYVTRQWRGSGDARIASNLAALEATGFPEPIALSDWEALVKDLLEGEIGGESYTQRQDLRARVLLAYASALMGIAPVTPERGDIDHLITRGQFTDENPSLMKYEHHIGNLELLPERANSRRGGTRLDLLNDPVVRDAVQKHSRIRKEDFDRFAQVGQVEALVAARGKLIRDVLCGLRQEFVDDPKQFEGPTSELWVESTVSEASDS